MNSYASIGEAVVRGHLSMGRALSGKRWGEPLGLAVGGSLLHLNAIERV